MRHVHYMVQAFDSENETGFIGLVTIDVLAQNEKEAISKAQRFVWGRAW